jgi:hypothetical protein
MAAPPNASYGSDADESTAKANQVQLDVKVSVRSTCELIALHFAYHLSCPIMLDHSCSECLQQY